ncbi:MAG: MaoC family dehydratase [Xanthomonadales bacterium]|nr:MaoC family dehydratase [Xanthomonadales bacterium]
MIESNISIEDFKNSAGAELGPSDWLLIDQERINRFADATNDHQFIHVDPKKAAATPFGTTIAHGFLSLSILPHLLAQIIPIPDGIVMGINYGADRVRFSLPVKVDSRVRASARIEKVSARSGGQFMVKTKVTLEIENRKRPAVVADILSLYVVALD